MTPREIALSICEPWFNGDPCEGCECHKVCTKLVERIEDAIKTDREWLEAKAQSYKNFALALQSERDRSADTGKTSDHFADVSKMVDQSEDALGMVASVREDRTVEATIKQSLIVEPVAWMCSDESLCRFGYARFSRVCEGAWNIPVYTAPPKREPLTDEEINALELPPSGTATIRDMVRIVERAHGIGGEE